MQRYAMVSGAIGAVFSLMVHNTALSDYKDLRMLGTSDAICAEGVKTKIDFQAWVLVNSDDVRAILEHAEWQGDADQLLKLISAGRFVETQYHPGTEFQWLAARENGIPVALRKQRWAGEAAFTGFEIKVKTGDRTETVVVPKVCCNFALLSQGVAVGMPSSPTVAELPEPTMIKSPGENQLLGLRGKITPFVKLTAGTETFRIARQSGTANPINMPQNPTIPQPPEEPVVEIVPENPTNPLPPEKPVDPEPTPPSTHPDPLKPVKTNKPEKHKPCRTDRPRKNRKPGNLGKKHHHRPYKHGKPNKSCRHSKSMDSGEMIENTADSVTAQNAANNTVMENESAASIGLRVGLEMPFTEKLSVSTSVGIVGRESIDEENSYPDASVHFDFEVTRKLSDSWFVSGGVGAWNVEDDMYSTNSVFVSAGSRLTERLGWFVEQRHFSDSGDVADRVTTAGLTLQTK